MTSRSRHAPLRAIQSKSNANFGVGGVRNSRCGNSAKRKSAVELLQETKAFYVKSETVRDGKQELRSTRSPDNWMTPSQPAKSPRCSQHTTELQDRLRLLLDLDAKENMDSRYGSPDRGGMYIADRGMSLSYCQHKSLPDLHMSPGHTSTETSEASYYDSRYGGDSRSAYSSSTQPLHATKSSDFRKMGYIISDGYSGRRCEFTTADPRVYASLRVTKSGEFLAPRMTDTQSYCWRRNSNTSSGNRSQHNSSSRHSQSADSGRQSQVGSTGLRTGRSGLPEVMSPSPQDTASDSGAEEGSPPLYRSDSCEADKRRPILRSKSDISHRYCAPVGRPPLALPTPPPMSSTLLERFFDHLGMDPSHYREMASHNSRSSSPVFFSSVSSIDSCLDLTSWTVTEPQENRVTEAPSIVERNARIIKWLCNCRKAQMTGLTLV